MQGMQVQLEEEEEMEEKEEEEIELAEGFRSHLRPQAVDFSLKLWGKVSGGSRDRRRLIET